MVSITCCRMIVGRMREIPSPFLRLIATGYYDGPTDGFVECSICSAVYAFHKLDWDENQNLRVFSMSPVRGRSFVELEAYTDPIQQLQWPTWVVDITKSGKILELIDGFRSDASPEEFVVVASCLQKTIKIWQPIGLHGEVDWFMELSLDRIGVDE